MSVQPCLSVASLDASGSLLVAGAIVLVILGLVGAAWIARRVDTHGSVEVVPMVDAVTGLPSRRRLDSDIAHRSEISPDGAVSVLMVDVDHFEQLLAEHGPVVADEILNTVGAMVAAEVRDSDVVYRYNSQKFSVLLPETSKEQAGRVAERVRLKAIVLDLSVDATITVSLGVADGDASSLKQVLQTADAALDLARADGRNRVVVV